MDGDWIETKDQGGSYYRLLQVSNIGIGTFRETDNFRYITEDTFTRLRCTEVLPGHILVSRMPEPVGRAWLVTTMPWKAVTAVDVAILEVDKNKLDASFCSYYLNSPQNLAYAAAQASGTTRLRITRRNLTQFPISLPPLLIQRKIAAVLSAYDDLIENNLRRIKILEEMARTIYREWFVHFRFPGHEHVRMINSPLGLIPEGWKVVPIENICNLKKDKYKEINHSKLPLIDLAKMLRNTLQVGDTGSPNELSTSRIIYKEDDILFGSIRPYLHKVALAPFEGVTNVSVLVLRALNCELRAFLTVFLFSEDTIRWTNQHSTGTKMPVIKWESMSKMPIILPNESILRAFQDLVWPMLQMVKNSSIRNGTLQHTRDLLLPKLISGDLDITTHTRFTTT